MIRSPAGHRTLTCLLICLLAVAGWSCTSLVRWPADACEEPSVDTSGWREHTEPGVVFRLPSRFSVGLRGYVDQPSVRYDAPGESFFYSAGGYPTLMGGDFFRVRTCLLHLQSVVTITTGLYGGHARAPEVQYYVVAIWWDFAGPGLHLSIGGNTASRAAHREMMAAVRTPRRAR